MNFVDKHHAHQSLVSVGRLKTEVLILMKTDENF